MDATKTTEERLKDAEKALRMAEAVIAAQEELLAEMLKEAASAQLHIRMLEHQAKGARRPWVDA